MSRKRISFSLLVIFAVSLISTSILLSSAQSGVWSPEELISENLGNGQNVNLDEVIKKNFSQDVNYTRYTYSEGSNKISIGVRHTGDSLYILIIVEYATSQSQETVSLYLANSNQTEDIFDKKQITMQNANNRNISSSITSDYFYNSSVSYVADSVNDDHFQGKANYSDDQSDLFRYYGFKILLNTPANTTEDAKISALQNYAIQVGIKDGTTTEKISSTLYLQVGPKAGAQDTGVGDYDFNTSLYLFIIFIIIFVSFGIFGIYIISSKSKVGILRMEE